MAQKQAKMRYKLAEFWVRAKVKLMYVAFERAYGELKLFYFQIFSRAKYNMDFLACDIVAHRLKRGGPLSGALLHTTECAQTARIWTVRSLGILKQNALSQLAWKADCASD